METKEWRFVDKSKWGLGPWQDEPDKKQWRDPATGMACMIRRNELMGNWCGYVGVPADHPWSGVEYSQCIADSCNEEHCYSHAPEGKIEVHGGLTYSAFCWEENKEHGVCHITEPEERLWWFGFDCSHACDLIPGMIALEHKHFPTIHIPSAAYCDMAYVEQQTVKLAAQLVKVRKIELP